MKKLLLYFIVGSTLLIPVCYGYVHYHVKAGEGIHRIGIECKIGVKGSEISIGTPVITIDDFAAECQTCGCRAEKIIIIEGNVVSFCDEHANHDPKDKNLQRFDSKEKTKSQKDKEELKEYQKTIKKK